MAATMAIYEINTTGTYSAGSGGTDKTSGTITFGATADPASPGPVVRGAGDVWSFKKWLHMRVTGGSFGTVTNPQFYTSGTGSLSSGVSFYVNDNSGGRTNTYPNGVGPTAPTDDTNHTSVATFLVGARKELDYVNYGTGTQSNGSWNAAGDIGDFVTAYAKVANTAGPGTMGTCTFTWTWDET